MDNKWSIQMDGLGVMEDDRKPLDYEAMAEGLAESIAYNKRVYDTFRGGEDGILGVRKKDSKTTRG